MENNQEFAIFFSDAPKGKKKSVQSFHGSPQQFCSLHFLCRDSGEVSDTESKR